MGLYDIVLGHLRCPYCGNIEHIEEQIKWTNDPYMHTYIQGDEIDVTDGIYDYATRVRESFDIECSNCNENIKYTIQVKNGKFQSIIPDNTHATVEKNNSIHTMLLERRDRELEELLTKVKKEK